MDLSKFEKFHEDKNLLPYEISHDPCKGRILIAKRDIKAGEVIFGEEALIKGPVKSPKLPVCLVCLRNAPEGLTCLQCSYPICSEECLEKHPDNPECSIITKSNHEELNYAAILPLRSLLMKESRPDDWKHFITFSSHIKEYLNSDEWGVKESGMVRQIREIWGLSQFSPEEIQMTEGIIYVNGLEHPTEDTTSETKGGARAFYPITSLCSHDCVNNTFAKRIVQEGEVILHTMAKSDIKEGDEITLHYSCGFKGRRLRRKILFEGWFFKCKCNRCMSGDELGTHMSSMRLCNCKPESNVVPRVEEDGEVACYECENCGKSFDVQTVEEMEEKLTERIESSYTTDIDAFENIIEDSEKLFHPHHFLLLILKWFLINLLGRKKGYQNNQLSRERLLMKLKYCQQYQEVLQIIDPGLSYNQGKTLWERYSVEVFLLQTDFAKQRISKSDFELGLKRLKGLLKRVLYCLQIHDEDSFEAKIYELASKASRSIDETLEFLKIM